MTLHNKIIFRPGGFGEGTPVQGQAMDSLSLASLALQLLASIHSLSGYPTTKILPEIHQVPLVEIQQRFCQGSCTAQAFYKPGEGVYIDQGHLMNFRQDLRRRITRQRMDRGE